MKLAGLIAAQRGQAGKVGRYVIEEIGRHHRGRDGRVAHHFAGEHQGVRGAKDFVYGVKIIQRVHHLFAGFGPPVHAKTLVAVDQIKQCIVFAFHKLQKFQVTEVAVGGLPLEIKLFFGLGGEQIA